MQMDEADRNIACLVKCFNIVKERDNISKDVIWRARDALISLLEAQGYQARVEEGKVVLAGETSAPSIPLN